MLLEGTVINGTIVLDGEALLNPKDLAMGHLEQGHQ
jgi:hypothetical protein